MKPLPVLSLVVLLIASLVASHASAVYEKADGFPWNMTLKGRHDQPIVDDLGGGFFMNVGPTGIRAQITKEHPAYFTVKYVFKNSPAAGKIKIGDIIIGANGKVMTVPHKFGRRTVSGWEGPMESMAILIEEAQGQDGKLELIVWPGGNKNEQKTVEVQIKPVGRFSKTFPFNCERSDKLVKELCDFLATEYDHNGSFGRLHTASASVLALMASGDNRYTKVIRDHMSKYYGKRYSSMNGAGFQSWTFGHDGIVMGEYYLLTKDKKMLPAMNNLAVIMGESQDPSTGGYMHRPYPFITKRIADGGPKGYGSMSGVAGLNFVAMSLFRAGGVDYPEEAYERLHQAYLRSADGNGSIGYGFNGWQHAIVRPKGDSAKVIKTAKGIGYVVPDAMEGVDEFEVVWPTPADPRFKPLDWIKNERSKVRVYVASDSTLKLIRDMTLPEPTKPFPHNGGRVHHVFRSGCGALGHAIGHSDNRSWKYLADHLADSCANSPQSLLDGHASTLLHTLWGSLGAAQSNERGFRHYMDGIKWWFIMAQTHDGGFVCMPGRDYASTDHVYATRNFPTATAALILSVKEAKLQITGADSTVVQRQNQKTDPDAGGRARTTRPRSGIDLSMLGEGYSVKHCADEAKLFAGNAPYDRVLQALDAKAQSDDEAGQEAAEFAERIRAWLRVTTIQIIKDAKASPAKTLASSRVHLQRMSGMSDANAILARAKLEFAGADPDTRTLSRYYDQLNKILAQEAERGANATTKQGKVQIKTLVERFIQKPDLSEELRGEAAALLDALGE